MGRKKSETIGSNVRWLMDQYDVTMGKVAEVIGCGRNTLTARFRNPGDFTISEVNRLAEFFKVDRSVLLDGKLS